VRFSPQKNNGNLSKGFEKNWWEFLKIWVAAIKFWDFGCP